MDLMQAKAYVIQIAKVIAADKLVEKLELQRIFEVMAAFDLGPEPRAEILDLLFFGQPKLKGIEVDTDLLDDDEIRISLAKDVLFLESQHNEPASNQAAQTILSYLGITPEQLAFLNQWVAWENAALKRLGAGKLDLADEKGVAELASRAAAIGIPLSALYFAGTVGLSAAGITSGLAALGGLSGLALLGLNPMTAGIAAIIVASISIKRIFDFRLQSGARKQAETALLQAKAAQQRYREFLVQDIAEFEKKAIRDRSTTRISKRQKAIETMRTLLLESIRNDHAAS